MTERDGDFFDDLFEDVVDEQDAGEATEVVEGSGRRAAQLPDGSGFLIIEGPGAGSVVADSGAAPISVAAQLPDRDTALDGDSPLVLVHRPHQHWRSLPRVLASIHAVAGENVALGVLSRLGSASEQSHQDFHGLCGAAAVRIVDPECCYPASGDLRLQAPSARRISRAPYFAGNPISVAEVLDLQRQRGANLLLTPGRGLDAADHQRSLDAAFADGDEALAALRPGERLALNLPITAAWLVRRPLREALLAQLLDWEQFATWYIRVQWPSSLRSETQPADEELLRGYRRLAELAADEDRRLLLPQTGLTGWFMLAFGATGFGTGLSGSDQAFREETGGGGGGSPRIERYFERQLLHTVERTVRRALTADPDYAACACPYCGALLASGSAWSHEYAALHQVFNTGALAASVAPRAAGRGGTHGAVRRTVRRAVRFAEGKPLAGLSEPRHLPVWDLVL